MIDWITGHNNFFYSGKKRIKLSIIKLLLNSIMYQGVAFVQVTVSCNLQQHKDAESLEKSNQI